MKDIQEYLIERTHIPYLQYSISHLFGTRITWLI